LIVRSALPVTKKELQGEKARERTQPKWPERTVLSCQEGCQVGVGIVLGVRREEEEEEEDEDFDDDDEEDWRV
jgi:hypothetical protein